jgi:IS4 transposase
VFLTNNLKWSPRSVADLYRCRWQIEVFFKQIKQTLQLGDFLGHNANAVRWQDLCLRSNGKMEPQRQSRGSSE